MTTSPASLLADLRAHTNVLLYGPPASGKTHLMQEVAELFLTGAGEDEEEVLAVDTSDGEDPLKTVGGRPPLVRWVTFHQSYSYEDFVLGLRPDPSTPGLFQLRPVPGVLLELAAHAAAGGESLLLIDEVNRGNTSRIFGEFITLLEPDKRLDDDGGSTSRTIHTKLPYLGEESALAVQVPGGEEVNLPANFALPRPIYTLATMNSVDKSIAPLDVALRRRFHMIQLRGTEALLQRAAGVGDPNAPPDVDTIDGIRVTAVRLLAHLNEGIAFYLGPDVELGPWYLSGLAAAESVPAARAEFHRLWWHSLLPQLEELFQGQPDQLISLLNLNSSTPVRVVAPDAERQRLGALPYLQRRTVDEPATLSFLRGLVAQGDVVQEEADEMSLAPTSTTGPEATDG